MLIFDAYCDPLTCYDPSRLTRCHPSTCLKFISSERPGIARAGATPAVYLSALTLFSSARAGASWVCDVIGLFDQDYQWHDGVKVWATPGAGEDAVAGLIGPPVSDRAAALVDRGMHEDVALPVAEGQNAAMGEQKVLLIGGCAVGQPAPRSTTAAGAASRIECNVPLFGVLQYNSTPLPAYRSLATWHGGGI